jgi:hypothetical protein
MREVAIYRHGQLLFCGPVLKMWSTGERLHVIYSAYYRDDDHLSFDWPWEVTVDSAPD